MIRTSKQRRSLKLATLGTVSIIGSLSTIVFYTGFAYLHDAGAEPMVQLCMLIATGLAAGRACRARNERASLRRACQARLGRRL